MKDLKKELIEYGRLAGMKNFTKLLPFFSLSFFWGDLLFAETRTVPPSPGVVGTRVNSFCIEGESREEFIPLRDATRNVAVSFG